jgi:hypothetical protein
MGKILDSRFHGNDGRRAKPCACAFLKIGFKPIPLEPLALQARVVQFPVIRMFGSKKEGERWLS